MMASVITRIVQTGMNATTAKVLPNISGTGDTVNDVIVYYGDHITQHVILFPGDVQDYYANMAKHRDNHVWKEYNLEDTARFTYERFPTACVWVIRASKLHLHTFACYKNFVHSNTFGVPSYSKEDITALLQTACLINSCIQQEFSEEIREKVSQMPVSLIGFSKGCMVLNQMMLEWPLLCSTNEHILLQFTNRIKELYLLDSGNCGQSGAWVTDELCLKEVARTVKFHLYVTPYQRMSNRVWVGEEFEVFKNCLISLGADVEEHFLFGDEEPSLKNHFMLLLRFREPNPT